MLRAVGWRTGGEARGDGRRGADGRGMHRASLAEGGRCALGALAGRARTGRAERPLNSRRGRGRSEGWRAPSLGCRKVGRIPPPRGLPTPLKKRGGLVGGRASVNRRRGAGCGGVNGAFIMAKLVGCYSHPRCFVKLSKAKKKKVPQSEAETRPKRLKNQMRL